MEFKVFLVVSVVFVLISDGVAGSEGTISTIPATAGENTTNTSNIGIPETTGNNLTKTEATPSCHLKTQSPYVYDEIRILLDAKVKLIEYKLVFPNYTVNPLLQDTRLTYNGDKWARVSTQHGQTLLSLAFNYGVFSLMTLTFGVEFKEVALVDEPLYCMLNLTEEDRMSAVRYLLMRDFKDTADITLEEEERICHELIDVQGPVAKFTDKCCFKNHRTGEEDCTAKLLNIWLTILYFLLTCVRLGILFFGPLLFIPIVNSLSSSIIPYTVKQKEPLQRLIYLTSGKGPIKIKYRNCLNLLRKCGFNKLKLAASDVILGQPTKVNIFRYDVQVDYKRLLPENSVPIGFWSCICRAIFTCKLRDIGPFQKCCTTNMFKSCSCVKRPVPWISFWKVIGRILMVLFIPIPYYLRLLIFYHFENKELQVRNAAILKLGVRKSYENSLIHYLTPTHPVFIAIYVSYFATALSMAYMGRKGEGGNFKRIIVSAFKDLEDLKWLKVLGYITSNCIWPFRRFGCLGCLVAIVYWPIAIPLTILVYTFNCLPPIYLTIRMMKYSRDVYLGKMEKLHRQSVYQIRKNEENSLAKFQTSRFLGYGEFHDEEADMESMPLRRLESREHDIRTLGPIRLHMTSFRHLTEHVVLSILCILTMYGVLLILSECLGVFIEMMIFTMMGIIVNAGAFLKYVTLLFLVLIYSYDCFNNVSKKYLKLNQALFNEIKGRIKDQIAQVTSLPAELQENTGFKSVENIEQADYESPDDLADVGSDLGHWRINDLVMFIDNEDMPRIPKKLFEDVCKINVAGAPGPVHVSYIEATKQFLVILGFLGFVFLVVLSFGVIYKISSTNQMLATLAGGFLPFLLRTFMSPAKPDLEIGTVSFKSKLDEIIQNFCQTWPIHDLPFELPKEDESDKKDEDEDSSKEEDEDEKSSKNKSEAVLKFEAWQRSLKEQTQQASVENEAINGNTMEMKVLNCNKGNGEVHFMTDVPESMEVEEVDIVIIMPDSYCEDMDDKNRSSVMGNDDDFFPFQQTPEPEHRLFSNV